MRIENPYPGSARYWFFPEVGGKPTELGEMYETKEAMKRITGVKEVNIHKHTVEVSTDPDTFFHEATELVVIMIAQHLGWGWERIV